MTDPLIGRTLAHYLIERLIGKGGMANVYYAEDKSLNRPVAVKVISAHLRDNETYAERFVQEARSIAQWRHNNVLQIYYAGEDEGLYFFAMEFVNGLNLEQVLNQYIDRRELVPHEDIVRIGRAIAQALDYAHSKNVVHRDIKPSNVLMAEDGRIVLADFGLAMDVDRGSLGETFGTPHYIAPEQAMNSADAVAQSDLYSLGIILYEMLTGVVPFDEPSSMSVALKHLTTPPPPPRSINSSLSQRVEGVLLKALEKEPGKRYGTGEALMDALDDAIQAQNDEESSGFYSLPPTPVGTGEFKRPAVSRLSVVDHIRINSPTNPEPWPEIAGAPTTPISVPATAVAAMPSTPAPVSESAAAPAPAPTASQSTAMSPMVMGGIGALIVAMLLGLGYLFLSGGEEPVTETAVVSETAAVDDDVIEAESIVEEVVEPTAVPEAVAIEPTVAPDTAEDVVVEVVEEEAEVVEPTAVPPTEEPIAEPTSPPPSPTAEAVPTLAFPNGHRLELVYDANSFYVYNTLSERVRISDIVFQAYDDGGRPLQYRLEGNRWTQFYPFVEGNACYSIEPFGMDGNYMRPGFCIDYSSSITPAQNGDELFWMERPEAVEFRALWGDVEIGRCSLGEGSCIVLVPAP